MSRRRLVLRRRNGGDLESNFNVDRAIHLLLTSKFKSSIQNVKELDGTSHNQMYNYSSQNDDESWK